MFQYVALLRRSPVSEPHWAELKQAGELSFKFTEASNAYDYVETIAEDWHFYPTQDILRADYLFSVFDAAAILRVLELLTPDNCALFLQMPGATRAAAVKTLARPRVYVLAKLRAWDHHTNTYSNFCPSRA